MGASTKIEWADKTFNPWIGCAKVSPACDGCYAEAMMDLRYHRVAWGGPGKGVGTRVRTSAANWRQPLAWDRAAAKASTRPFVFCASLADVFDNAVPAEWRRDLFDLIRKTPHLMWLLLTKRPGNIARLYGEAMLDPPDGGSGYPWPENAAVGCTVVTQEEADRDVPVLLRAKADLHPAFAFLSMEPLLGPVDLSAFLSRLEWIITGGESGDEARPTHPDWFRLTRDQAVAAGVAYHHKQNGEWAPGEAVDGPPTRTLTGATWFAEKWMLERVSVRAGEEMHIDDEPDVWRVGKRRAGRLLDGRTWDERPAVPAVRRDAA